MIKCRKCGAEYDNFATYCNECDLPLVDESGKTLEIDKDKQIADAKFALAKTIAAASVIHRILGWLYFIVVALGLTFYLVIGKAASSRPYFLLLLAIPAVIHLVTAEGLLRRKKWARTLSIVLGIVLLFGFPIGTVVGTVLILQMSGSKWQYA